MTLIDDLITELYAIEIGQNTAYDFAIALLIFLASFIILYILKFVVLSRLDRAISEKKQFEKLDTVLDKFRESINIYLITLLSLYIGLKYLILSPSVETLIDLIVKLVITYYLLKFSFVVVDYTLTLSERLMAEEAESLLEFISAIAKGIFAIIIILWFLSSLGIDTAAFVASLGVLSLAIAFALQNVISDVFAALTLYIDKPFEVGDTIQISDDIGQVEKIGIRSTRIRTLQGQLLIVSNRELLNTNINNFQKLERRRVPFTVGVHVDTPVEKLRQIPQIIEEIIVSVDKTDFDRAFMNALGKFTYDFDVVYFISSSSYTEYLRIHQEINYNIIERFQQEGIIIPYPTENIEVQYLGKEDK